MPHAVVSSSQPTIEFPLRLLRTTRPRRISADDIRTLRAVERTDWTSTALAMGSRRDEELAARAVSLGALACLSFGNGFALASHPGEAVADYARGAAFGGGSSVVVTGEDGACTSGHFGGRNGDAGGKRACSGPVTVGAGLQADGELVTDGGCARVATDSGDLATASGDGVAGQHVPCITTTLRYIPEVFDWTRLPAGLRGVRVMELIDTLFELGPFGFVGPAGASVPQHLRAADGTVRLVGAGYLCRSNAFLERAMDLIGTHLLHLIPLDGAAPPDLLQQPGCFAIRELGRSTRRAQPYAAYRAGAPTVLALHQLSEGEGRKPILRIEQHGSLHIDHLRPILDSLGFSVTLATPSTEERDAVLAA